MNIRILLLCFLTLAFVPAEGSTQSQATHVPLAIGAKSDSLPLVGREFSLSYVGKRLPEDALLEVSGSLPDGLSASIPSRHTIVLSGSVTLPQVCELSFRAIKGNLSSKKTITRRISFSKEDGSGVYQGTIQKVAENETHIKYEIQATNLGGLPISSATIRTFLSGAAGGQFQNDSVVLPDIRIGNTASTTIWYKKGTGFPGTAELILNGKSVSDERLNLSNKKTKFSLSRTCTYSELMGKVPQ